MTASDSFTSPPLARAISVLESTTVKLEDDYDHKPRSSRARTSTQKPKKLESEEELEEEDEDEGITRCVCAEDNEELAQALMIQCDTCKCWQHGPCVGLWGEKDCPDRYFCELCRPGWHGPGGILRKAHRKSVPTAPARPTRSPSVGSARNKPRESADAALVAAFLATEMTTNPAVALEREQSKQLEINAPSEPAVVGNGHRRSTSAHSVGRSGPKADENGEKASKKRSTMNSRDAAYDDAIALSILGPGTAAMRARLDKNPNFEDEDEEEDALFSQRDIEAEEQHLLERQRDRSNSRESAPDEIDAGGKDSTSGDDYTIAPSPPAKKRRRIVKEPVIVDHVNKDKPALFEHVDDEETLENGDTSREGLEETEHFDEEGDTSLPNAPARAKHPNQYTYRPKPSGRSRASPHKRNTTNRGESSASHSNSSHLPNDHAPPRASHHKASAKETHAESGWGLPEHLKHLAHLLPTPTPKPIYVPTFTSAYVEAASTPPPPLPQLEAFLELHGSIEIDGLETHLEMPTRIKFPSKRMTMPEMRKRTKNMLDFINRIQLELTEREKRASVLAKAAEGIEEGIGTTSLDMGIRSKGRAARRQGGRSARTSEGRSTPEEIPVEKEKDALALENTRMMSCLTEDVLFFQQRYFGSID